MPRESTDRRKSSIGTRRGPPRRHIPFRADDLARGKKTGMAVGYVDRNSDEFEPFEQVIKQADNRTPPPIKSKKKRMSIAPPVEQVDEDGEMSMELAESNQGSPLAYFTNANTAYAPDSSRRPVISRTIARASEIDYDQIPSPKSYLSVRPRSANGRTPSALSKSYVPHEPTPDPDADYADQGAFDDFELPQPDDEPPRSPTPEATPDGAGETEDAEEVEEPIVTQSQKVDKGKRRADPVEEDAPSNPDANGLEDDIAQGLQEVENAQDDEDNAPPPKKSRNELKAKKPRAEKRAVKTPVDRSPTPEGVRRGRRHRYRPLEWWRQEKVVYGRRDSDLILVPQIKEIIRVPREPVKPLGKAGKRKRGVGAREKSKGDTPFNPEDGWDDDTPTNATVVDYDTQEEVSRRVAFLAKMIELKPAGNSNWFFQKIFGEGEFIAAGQMHIPPGSQKPSKSTKDNTYVFYVIQGAVSVFIHETSFIITTGGMFLVPRGNTYYIENIAERDAKLFFTQARMLPTDGAIQVQHTAQSAPPLSHRRAISEDVSAGPKKGSRKA